MNLTQNGDLISLTVDIGSLAVKRDEAGRKQRVLVNETRKVINSDGKVLWVTVKVATGWPHRL